MAAFTYPGVYIEEISSGQHTITGVATSIAAFIGWANQGPVTEAVMVESWSEYQATFGGMIPGVYLGYAVYQFFLNGGSQAYIVRLAGTDATIASSTIGGLEFSANSPGGWGNSISLVVSNVNTANGTFNLQVLQVNGSVSQTVESYTNLSNTSTSPQFAPTVINADSNYITTPVPSGPPPTTITLPTATFASTIAGSVTSGTFVANEQVIQTTSTASAYLIGTVTGAGPMKVGPIIGSPLGGDTWVGQTSGAVYTPTAVPVLTAISASVALNTGTGATQGNDGTTLLPNTSAFEAQLASTASATVVSGYPLLSSVPIFNLLCVPGETDAGLVGDMQSFCATNRAFLIVDSAQAAVVGNGSSGLSATGPADSIPDTLVTQYASNSGFYFPWVLAPDPQVGFRPTLFPPCGFVAGIFASTDASRGVWKAPAGINASLTGALGLQFTLTDLQNGSLNQLGINCLRQFPTYGNVVWGARTIAGADAAGSQWKYIPIRRLALFLESSLYAGTQWAVFEPNAEPLWGQVRLSIGTFMQGLFLQGAFAGTTPQQAYFVKCDGDNNPDSSVAMGILNITVGFAPLYPAEFVVIQIQQLINQG